MLEHFRGVIWPRHKTDGKRKVYRYTVVGMLVTDEPISEFEGKHEILLDGAIYGVAELLGMAHQAKFAHRAGTADSVLLKLDQLVDVDAT